MAEIATAHIEAKAGVKDYVGARDRFRDLKNNLYRDIKKPDDIKKYRRLIEETRSKVAEKYHLDIRFGESLYDRGSTLHKLIAAVNSTVAALDSRTHETGVTIPPPPQVTITLSVDKARSLSSATSRRGNPPTHDYKAWRINVSKIEIKGPVISTTVTTSDGRTLALTVNRENGGKISVGDDVLNDTDRQAFDLNPLFTATPANVALAEVAQLVPGISYSKCTLENATIHNELSGAVTIDNLRLRTNLHSVRLAYDPAAPGIQVSEPGYISRNLSYPELLELERGMQHDNSVELSQFKEKLAKVIADARPKIAIDYAALRIDTGAVTIKGPEISTTVTTNDERSLALIVDRRGEGKIIINGQALSAQEKQNFTLAALYAATPTRVDLTKNAQLVPAMSYNKLATFKATVTQGPNGSIVIDNLLFRSNLHAVKLVCDPSTHKIQVSEPGYIARDLTYPELVALEDGLGNTTSSAFSGLKTELPKAIVASRRNVFTPIDYKTAKIDADGVFVDGPIISTMITSGDGRTLTLKVDRRDRGSILVDDRVLSEAERKDLDLAPLYATDPAIFGTAAQLVPALDYSAMSFDLARVSASGLVVERLRFPDALHAVTLSYNPLTRKIRVSEPGYVERELNPTEIFALEWGLQRFTDPAAAKLKAGVQEAVRDLRRAAGA